MVQAGLADPLEYPERLVQPVRLVQPDLLVQPEKLVLLDLLEQPERQEQLVKLEQLEQMEQLELLVQPVLTERVLLGWEDGPEEQLLRFHMASMTLLFILLTTIIIE
jgi:hypothetical protein